MQDEDKSKEQLIAELHELRQQLAESEKDGNDGREMPEALRDQQFPPIQKKDYTSRVRI